MRKSIDLFTKLAKDDPEEYKEVSKLYGNALRIGMLESKKDHVKIAKLLRFESTRSDFTSLEEVSFLRLDSADWRLTHSMSRTARRAKSRSTT